MHIYVCLQPCDGCDQVHLVQQPATTPPKPFSIIFNRWKQYGQYQYKKLKEEKTEEEEKLLQDYEDNWTQKGDGKCEEENKDGSGNNDNGEYKN